MSRDGNPPFGRGEYEDSQNLDHLIGRVYEFEDIDFSSTTRPYRSGRMVKCMLVRNDTGSALLPKRIAAISTTAGEYNKVANGYTALDNERGFPVDEFLPAAGVADGDYFYVVVQGPAMVLTPLAGAGFNDVFTVGGRLVALTAVTTGATTAGRVANPSLASVTALADAHGTYIGRALSAATTGNTNTGVLLDVGRW